MNKHGRAHDAAQTSWTYSHLRSALPELMLGQEKDQPLALSESRSSLRSRQPEGEVKHCESGCRRRSSTPCHHSYLRLAVALVALCSLQALQGIQRSRLGLATKLVRRRRLAAGALGPPPLPRRRPPTRGCAPFGQFPPPSSPLYGAWSPGPGLGRTAIAGATIGRARKPPSRA
jgi:hypothetical protein